MEKIKQELYDVYLKYKDFDFMKYYHKISKTNTNNKYSRGIGFSAGLYEPSFVHEMMCTNMTIGKEIKRIDKGYDYKYYFDENDRILLSEKYLDGKLCYINFYFYHDSVLEFIHYEVNRGIYSLSKSFYDEKNRINRHIEIRYYNKYNWEEDPTYDEHLFRYDDNITYIKEITYYNPPKWLINDIFRKRTEILNMKIIDNILYCLDDNLNVKSFNPIRFKIVDGKKVSVPLPKKVPVFKIIKENMIKILDKWKDIDKSVIWINCESSNLEMQYTTLKEDSEEKWNIAFYDDNEEKIFEDKNHIQVLEDLLFNKDCNVDDLINESDYFVNKMINIIKELRKEGYIEDSTSVILSNLEVSDKTIEIANKINKNRNYIDFL